MVLCLVTLTDLQTRRAGLSASAELLVHKNRGNMKSKMADCRLLKIENTLGRTSSDLFVYITWRCTGLLPSAELYVCIFRNAWSASTLFVRGEHSLNRYCVMVYGSILMGFSEFFTRDCPIRCTKEFLFLSLGGATMFTTLQSKIAKSPKSVAKFVRTTSYR